MCFDYDDYPEMCVVKTVVCRKQHDCEGCGNTIPSGHSAKSVSGKFEGEFFRYYECEQCQRVALSIAAEEIQRGCCWSEAWCAPWDLRDYLADQPEPLTLLEGSIEDCWQQVNSMWAQRQEAT